eukprot:scaffold79162_cov24-Attheya_sp.AAC.1
MKVPSIYFKASKTVVNLYLLPEEVVCNTSKKKKLEYAKHSLLVLRIPGEKKSTQLEARSWVQGTSLLLSTKVATLGGDLAQHNSSHGS